MKQIITLLFLCILLASCPSRKSESGKTELAQDQSVQVFSKNSVVLSAVAQKSVRKFEKSENEIHEMLIQFSNLEKELLTIIRDEFQSRQLPIEIVEKIYAVVHQIKPASSYVCPKVYKKMITSKKYEYFENCEKNPKKLFEIEMKSNQEFRLIFESQNWSKQLGVSVSLTAPRRECSLKYNQGRLLELSCQNSVWGLQLQQENHIEEIRLVDFKITPDQNQQVILSGSFYKDLVQTRKIELTALKNEPLRIQETALKVRDDFANLLIESKEVKNEEKTESTKKTESAAQEEPVEKNEEKNSEVISEQQTSVENQIENQNLEINSPESEIPQTEEFKKNEDIHEQPQPGR